MELPFDIATSDDIRGALVDPRAYQEDKFDMFDMTCLTSGIAEFELTSAERARVVGISCVGCLLQGGRGRQSALAWGDRRWWLLGGCKRDWRKRKMKEKKRKRKSRLVNEDVNVERCLDAQKMTGGQLP